MSIAHRRTGWLTPRFHYGFRELMVHAATRYHLLCPVYCLMPDHLHFIWMGLRTESNQLDATAFLRTYLKPLLAVAPAPASAARPGEARSGAGAEATKLQHQAFDHVLRDEERRRNAFARTCAYIIENPVRAGLVKRALDYEFAGAVVQGYPKWHPCDEHFWRRFWVFYGRSKDNQDPSGGCAKIR